MRPYRVGMNMPALVLVFLPLAQPQSPPERIDVDRDNVAIDHSCTVRIAPGKVIRDADGNGVIQIVRDGVTVTFEDGSVLRGAVPGTPPDTMGGCGVRVQGVKGVTIRGLVASGFKVGLWATDAPGLSLDSCTFDDNFRQHLRSTPEAEDSGDWLWPHENDNREWAERYGGAVVVERCDGTTIRRVRVRRGQNGIILDRVNHARLCDNDCSFLSGWGLAMWRSSDNVISRNALDFCVRGHSEGVYNRGQDSAGILCFEQCSRNWFVENSATHSGDCFFGFAGKEAIGEKKAPPGFDYAGSGCNANVFIGNDFSYAPAHGLELTFSQNNIIARNRFIENAICGIWGGYSNDTTIADNTFERNGGMAYGLENGAINIEHGAGNRIISNRFVNNRTGVHLWWDDDKGLLDTPGVKARNKDVTGNIIAGNTFIIDGANPFQGPRDKGSRLCVLRLRDLSKDKPMVRDNTYAHNTVTLDSPQGFEFDVTPGREPVRGDTPGVKLPDASPFTIGDTHPVGARDSLGGRGAIIMGEWGPWDHESPMVRLGSNAGGARTYEVFGPPGGLWEWEDLDTGEISPWSTQPTPAKPLRLTVPATGDVHPYRYRIRNGTWSQVVSGTIVNATWDCRFFSWEASTDPREKLDQWRELATAGAAVGLDSLNFTYGAGGPADQPWASRAAGKLPGRDHFGMIAHATITLPAGKWKFSTLSDDGVRVTVNQTRVIENWAWHAPTRDSAVYEQKETGPVDVQVEHFEIDGYAILTLDITPEE